MKGDYLIKFTLTRAGLMLSLEIIENKFDEILKSSGENYVLEFSKDKFMVFCYQRTGFFLDDRNDVCLIKLGVSGSSHTWELQSEGEAIMYELLIPGIIKQWADNYKPYLVEKTNEYCF